MRINRILLMMIILLWSFLFADVHITEGGVVGTGQQGQIHLKQNLRNDGQFVYTSSHIRFFGDGVSNVFGNSGLYVRRLVLDKASDGFLYLMEPVGVGDSLLLKSGTIDCPVGGRSAVSLQAESNNLKAAGSKENADLQAASSIDNAKKELQSTRSKKSFTRMIEPVFEFEAASRESALLPLNVTERDGSLTLADGATIRAFSGGLAQTPILNGNYNIIYEYSRTTNGELVSDMNALRAVTLDMSYGTITLDKDTWINQYLDLNTNYIDTGDFTLTMGPTAPVVGSPDNITGTIVGAPIYVGNSSYVNSTFLYYITSGSSIGNLYGLMFTEPETLGTTESINRLWYLDSDISPFSRNMQFGWTSSEDNGLDLTNVQLWNATNRNYWVAFGEPEDLSSSGTIRAIAAYGVSSLGWWTVGHPLFNVSTTAINLGSVEVGESAYSSITISNITESNQYGYVITPEWIEPNISTRTRDAARRERSDSRDEDDQNRAYAYYSIPPSSSIQVTLVSTPEVPGAFYEEILVRCNQTGHPTRVITVTGTAVMPDIVLSPTEFTASQATDEVTSQSLSIHNAGQMQLDYSVSIGSSSLSETFDGDFPPEGWTTQILQQSTAWTQSAEYGQNDSYSAVADWHYVYDSRLITPPVTIIGPTVLSYWVRSQDFPYYGGMLDVEVSTDGETWTSIDSYNQDTLTQQFTYKTLDLTAYGGSTIYIAFRAYENYWADGVFLDDVRVMNTSPPSWLTVNDSDSWESSIAAGGADHELTISFDSSGLADGTYSSDLVISSNDPFEPNITIPITLSVETPACQLSANDINFGTVILGESATRQFTISNPGHALLCGTMSTPAEYDLTLVSTRSSAHREDSVQFESLNDGTTRESMLFCIAAGSSKQYQITFTPSEIGDYEDVLTVEHNAPGTPNHIGLWATAITLPTVQTIAVGSISNNTAEVTGVVTASGGIAVTSRGVCWDTQEQPTLDDNYTVEGYGTGTFISTLAGLLEDTVYYARAYAINAAGTSYGTQLIFHTLSLGPPSAPEDVQLAITETGIFLTWSEVSDADMYYIYRVDDPSISDWGEPVGNTLGTSWLDTAPMRDGMAFYRITAVHNARPVILQSSGQSVRE